MNTDKRLQQLLNKSRLFELQYDELLEKFLIDEEVYDILVDHFFSYISYFQLSDEQITEIHMKFLVEYNKHLLEFSKTKKYPFQNNIPAYKSRLDYDVPLLCSSLLSYQRYSIFEILVKKIRPEPTDKVLVVGVGPGIEIALLKNQINFITAYDTEISAFIKNQFPEVHFSEALFRHDPDKLYEHILLIEILEHLENPWELLSDSIKSLAKNGCIHFTTAVNIPQFDHLYNFELNDEKLTNFILENNCGIIFKSNIPHNYKVNVEAYSCYYIIKKNSHLPFYS